MAARLATTTVAATASSEHGAPTEPPPSEGQRRVLHCEPQGCQQWRVHLAGDLQELAVTAIADDGTIVIGQRDRVLAVGPDGGLA